MDWLSMLDEQAFTDVLNLCLSELQLQEMVLTPARVLKLSTSLNLTPEQADGGLQKLMKLVIDVCRGAQSISEATDYLPESLRNAFRSTIESQITDVKALLAQKQRQRLAVDQLIDIDWRLEFEVANRCCRNLCKPQYLLELTTSSGQTHCRCD